ncbi:hypothetical protein JKA74_14325 [Marivirga sp. S37H4]|uniref:DUF4340 domain-containing protein n=1 Tax=Marivirga aurantiaca TaxID=2802615 RepID=A0A935CCQ3_9BACT|nr:hypothetical protein [Marivirga aurantiaca]MBK6266218.1 hypothetical protein [Marivirga aurantiaca]
MSKAQKNKNIGLLVLLLVLVVGAIWAYQYNPYSQKSTTFDKQLFAVEDPAEQLTKISMQSDKISNVIEKKDGVWRVNDTYDLDPSMKEVLMALLERISIQREVTGQEMESIKDQVLDTGIHVQLYGENDLLNEFKAGGSLATVSSYFLKDDQVYSMHLPGYQSYVAGIFEVKESDWRDRTIFPGTWQDIVSMEILEADGDSLEFKYDEGLIKWPHPQADSVKVMDFVEQFNYFYVDQYLTKDNEVFRYKDDFQLKGKINIEALNSSRSLQMTFYTVPNFNAILVNFKDDEWGAIPIARANKFFPKKENLMK